MRVYKAVRNGVLMAAVLAVLGYGAYALLAGPGEAVVVGERGQIELNGEALEAVVLTSRGDASPVTARPLDDPNVPGMYGTSHYAIACQGYMVHSLEQRQINLLIRRLMRANPDLARREFQRDEDPCASVRQPVKVVVARDQ